MASIPIPRRNSITLTPIPELQINNRTDVADFHIRYGFDLTSARRVLRDLQREDTMERTTTVDREEAKHLLNFIIKNLETS